MPATLEAGDRSAGAALDAADEQNMTVAGDTAVRGEGLEWVGAAVPASGDAGDGEWRPTRAMEEESSKGDPIPAWTAWCH